MNPYRTAWEQPRLGATRDVASLLILVAVLLFVSLSAGCGWLTSSDMVARDARIVANTAALTLAASQSTAELLYEAEQRLVVERGAREPGITKAELRRRVAVVRQRWGPVKEAFAKARQVHAALAAALERGASPVEIAPLAAELTGLEARIADALNEARGRLEGG